MAIGKKDANDTGKRARAETIARLLLEKDNRLPGLVDRLLGSDDDKIVLDTLKFLFEQGYGRAASRNDSSGDDGKPKRIVFNIGSARIEPERPAIDAELVGPALLPASPG